MGKGSIIELLNRGAQDQYFTMNPQITFFKKIYKRHTNFSTESIRVNFDSEPDFGKKITCTIGRSGDLINKSYLVVTLPKINKFQESNNQPDLNKCAWTENIGFHIIKKIELEIGGYIIDKQYGDYMYIWSELSRVYNNKRGLDKMVGNVTELLDYTNSKNSYMLTVPLTFWFCEPGLSLPIIALEFVEVKVNVEFAALNGLLRLVPSHYIDINEFMVHYTSGELISQTVNGKKIYAEYIGFDNMLTSNDANPVNRLYYNKINREAFVPEIAIESYKNGYTVMPKTVERVHVNKQRNFAWINELSIKDAYLLVDYVYLDVPERLQFVNNECEYLIDVLHYDSDRTVTHNSTKLKIGYTNLCKEIIVRGQMDYLSVNYRSNYMLNYLGKDEIIQFMNIIMNGNVRLSNRDVRYYSHIQPFQNHSHRPPDGVYIYSFSLDPNNALQPSGTVNLSKIDDFQINLTVNREVNYSNPVKIRVYARCYNVLVIHNGFGGLKYAN